MDHELISAFETAGLPLGRLLRKMLADHPSHCTERRGCGLTQATRLLGECINRPRDPLDTDDLALFEGISRRRSQAIARAAMARGWNAGWRDLATAPDSVLAALAPMPGLDALQHLPDRLQAVARRIEREESLLLLQLIAAVVSAGHDAPPVVPGMLTKPAIGSCSQAEEYFLEIAHGKIRRGGSVNVLVDRAGQAVMLEKMDLGESHSAITLCPLTLHGVPLPPGSLTALRHRPDVRPRHQDKLGCIMTIDDLAAARFLRLTTLSVTPANRERAFSTQYHRQVSGNMLSPATTTLDDLRSFALDRLRAG